MLQNIACLEMCEENIVAFTEEWNYVTDFQVSILIISQTKSVKIRHYWSIAPQMEHCFLAITLNLK